MTGGIRETGGVRVDELSVRSVAGGVLLAPTSLRAPRGSVTALTGPSGVGKTTLMRAVLGHLAAGAVRAQGSVHVDGQDVFALGSDALRSFRRAHLAYVGQDPGAALNPALRVRSLLREAAPRAREEELAAALDRVGLPERYLRRRPGELSGGEQRRVALAIALVRRVGVLVVDEPLAGLHGELRGSITDLLRALATDDGVAVVVSGHHTEIMHRLADEVVALGGARWTGLPSVAAASVAVADRPSVLAARAISARAGRRTVVDSVELDVAEGESVAVVGPSGAGKTTLARVLAGIHTEASGSLLVRGRELAIGRGRRSRRDRRRVQLIPQNPLSTLNPKQTVLQTLSRPLRLIGTARADLTERAATLLDRVELDRDLLRRLPDELSGGQRQRVAIARALAVEPDVLLCDEITSALDEATARAVMDLMDRTRSERRIGVVVVSHDMDLVARYCSRIVVLADGRVVERGDTAEVLADPGAAETRTLLV